MNTPKPSNSVERNTVTEARTTETAVREKTTTVWLDRDRNGRAPWGKAKTGLLGAAGLAGILGLTSLWAVPTVEDKLSGAAFDRLEAQGIDTEGLDIDFDWTDDYRSAEITGELPAGTTAAEVESIAAGTDGIRNVSMDVDEAPAPIVEPEPEPEPAPEPEPEPLPQPAATTPVEATATLAAGTITLAGEVASEDHRAQLLAAAEEAVGPANVVDNLTVAGLDPEVDGADDRVVAMAGVIARMNVLDEGRAEMTDSDLTLTGTASDEGAQALAEELAAASDGAFANGADANISLDAPAAPPEVTLVEEVDLLQGEIDLLAQEIRDNVVFDTDSDVITPVAAGTLDKVVAAMNKYPRPVVEVGGHTDSDGDDDYNRELSQRRAESVDRYLADKGIDSTRLQGVGFGEANPIDTNDTDEGKQENRRVEFAAKASF